MSSANSGYPSVPQSDVQLSEFLLRACHDLRSPLRAVRTYAELLQRDNPSPESLPSLGFIVDGSAKTGQVIDGLTEYSLALQIDPGTFQPVPLEVMLRAALAKLAAPLQEQSARVTYDSLPTVSGNSDRLLQLFEYLIDNAMRNRAAEAPHVHVTAEARSDDWLFRMRDNGRQIEQVYLDRVFKPFERIHGKERPGPGLAICRIIIERHGGTIWVESSKSGSTFCFTLPADR